MTNKNLIYLCLITYLGKVQIHEWLLEKTKARTNIYLLILLLQAGMVSRTPQTGMTSTCTT